MQLAGPTADANLPWHDLYEAVERRHTSRMPFTGRPVPDPIVREMIDSARAEGAHLDVPGIMRTRRLLHLTQEAEERNAAHPARAAKARAWITAPGKDAAYGIPVTAPGPRDASGRMPVRDFTGALPVPRLPASRFERHAQVALLWTAHDRPEDWLKAGQALERVLLTAVRHGVRTSRDRCRFRYLRRHRARLRHRERRLRQRLAAVQDGRGEVECPECGARWGGRHLPPLGRRLCSPRCKVRAWRRRAESFDERSQ